MTWLSSEDCKSFALRLTWFNSKTAHHIFINPYYRMKLEVIESDSNYVATIVKLPELKTVNGLDNLMLANVFGYNCLVGKDSNPNELYVFFPAECVLSEKFLSWNNLYRKSEMNVEKFKSGFFDESGRVKAVKFKGIVSSGFLIPVKSLLIICSYTDLKV